MRLTARDLVDRALLDGIGLGFSDVRMRPGRPMKKGASRRRYEDFDFAVDLDGVKLDFPLLAAPMDTVNSVEAARVMQECGAGTVFHRNLAPGGTFEQLVEASVDLFHKLQAAGVTAFMSVPMKRGAELAKVLYDLGQRHFCVESAAAWCEDYMAAVKAIHKACPQAKLIVGNTADPNAAVDLARLPGVIAIRVGIGGGSACTTSEGPGIGVPQLTAIVEAVDALVKDGRLRRERTRKKGVFVISDGGIRSGGDIAKAFAAGADVVMIGGLLAAHDESPGEIIERKGRKFKRFRGMSEKGASADQRSGEFEGNGEGVKGLVQHRGSLARTVHALRIDVNSAATYNRCRTLKDFRSNCEFLRITSLGAQERAPASFIERDTE